MTGDIKGIDHNNLFSSRVFFLLQRKVFKVKSSEATSLRKFVIEFGKDFSTDDLVILCYGLLCEEKNSFATIYSKFSKYTKHIRGHFNATTHIVKLKLYVFLYIYIRFKVKHIHIICELYGVSCISCVLRDRSKPVGRGCVS